MTVVESELCAVGSVQLIDGLQKQMVQEVERLARVGYFLLNLLLIPNCCVVAADDNLILFSLSCQHHEVDGYTV